VTTLRRDAQTRRDALDGIANLAAHPVQNVTLLGEALQRARAAMDTSWSAEASRAGEAARRLTAMIEGGAVPPRLPDEVRGLEADVAAATRAIGNRLDDLSKLAREHHRLRVLDAYETARTDGVRRLARGDLSAARAELNRLRELLVTAEKDTSLRPLLDGFEKRGIFEFLAMRDAMSKAIDEGLASALEAERTGNLAGASALYARLVRQFPQVRFDDVFTIPLRVQCVPPSARVAVNGHTVDGDGSGTMVVRYGWGASATLSVTADGYEPASVVLDTSAERPRADLAVRLIPARTWTATLPGTVEAPVFSSRQGIVVATRSGRIECRDTASGTIRWTVETRCVEGVRGRSAATGDQLLVPLLDGRVARIAMSTGGALPPFQLRERPVGDAASSGNRVAFAMDASLAVFTDGDNPTYIPLPASTTAGVLSALGAFWVGDATGGITRVDAASLLVRTIRPGGRAAVVGLASDAKRVYALTEDGALHAVGGTDQQVAWTRPGLGDVMGNPAVAAGVIAVAQRGGRVALFHAADGAPKGGRETGSPARDGLVASGDRVVAALSDGRLWIYDAARDSVIVDAPLEGTARIGPSVTDDGIVIAPAGGNGIAALPLPK
jgi:outer membrane protein assembly factor BamB